MDRSEGRDNPRLSPGVSITETVAASVESTASKDSLWRYAHRLERAEARAHIGSWELDLRGGEHWWSAELCRLFYRDPDLGTPSLEDYVQSVHPHDRALVMAAVRQMEQGQLPDEQEFRTNPDYGPMRHLAPSATIEKNAQGQPLRFAGTVRDVTEQRQSEALLRQNEHLLEIASRSAHIGGWSLEVSSRNVHWSAEVCRIHGVAADSTLTCSEALDFVAPEKRRDMRRNIEACIAQAEPFDDEFTIQTTAGHRCCVRIIGHPVQDQTGDVVRVQGSCQDITEYKDSVAEVSRLGETLALTMEAITDAFITIDRDWNLTYLNRQAEKILSRNRDDILAKCIWQVFPETKGTAFEFNYRQAVQENCPITFEEFFPPLEAWLEVRVYPSGDGLALFFRNITAQKKADKRLEEAQERTRLIVDTALDAIVAMNADSIIIGWNQQAEAIFGWPANEIIGRFLPECIIPRAYREKHIRGMKHFFETGEGLLLNRRVEILALHRDGHEFPVELSITVLPSEGEVTFSAFIRDITERKRSEQEIAHLAFYDPLTELPNRRLLEEQLHHALAASLRNGVHGALLFIDLDNFKTLNDTLGHHIGDLLLREVAARLTDCVRESDMVARFAGDEFVVILENLSNSLEEATLLAEAVGEKILFMLRRPYDLHGHERHNTASIGIALFGQGSDTAGDLMKKADMALYQAKSTGRNEVKFFDPEAQVAIIARAGLEALLRDALMRHEMILHYQPQIDSIGNIIGAEVLMRWNNAERGIISPSEFIPVAESSDLIIPLGDYALGRACEQLAAFAQQEDMAAITISVNISARQFHHPDFVKLVRDNLDRTGANPQRLMLELTETVLVDDIEDTIVKMTALKIEGVNFSLDDFGTGYSSLYYLKRLPLDELKIDQSFVRDVYKDPNDAAIVRAILVMAQSLGLRVIAEGVETEDARRFLDLNGCQAYQGYLFSRPLSIDHFQEFVRQPSVRH